LGTIYSLKLEHIAQQASKLYPKSVAGHRLDHRLEKNRSLLIGHLTLRDSFSL
jgi:hypothetical protein